MAYVEVRKNGKLISRKEVTAAEPDGVYALRVNDGSELRLRPGQPVHQGGYPAE